MIGLAPEIPEDLYMLIKKVCMILISAIEIKRSSHNYDRPLPSANISNAIAKTKTRSSVSF